MGKWSLHLTNHFNADQSARGQFGNAGRAGYAVHNDQRPVRTLGHPDGWHSGGGGAKTGDLAVQLNRVGPARTRCREVQVPGINVKERLGHTSQYSTTERFATALGEVLRPSELLFPPGT